MISQIRKKKLRVIFFILLLKNDMIFFIIFEETKNKLFIDHIITQLSLKHINNDKFITIFCSRFNNKI